MLDRLRNYIVAVVAAALTLLSLIGVTLSLTVWKPAQEVVATTSAAHPLVMTREKVLPLLASEVNVSVKGGSADEVAVVFGSTADVRGWIGDSAFTEVVGLEAGYKELAVEDHNTDSAQSGDAAQSDSGQSGAAQSGAATAQQPQSAAQTPQSGDSGQSGDNPQSVETIADVLANNDMWVNTANGVGEVSLRLPDVDGPVSVLAVSSGENPTITLRWGVHSTNVALIFFGILSALFGALTVWAFVRQFMLERSRVARAAQLDAREHADNTDTTALSVEEIAARGEAREEEETLENTEAHTETELAVEDDNSVEETDSVESDSQPSTQDDLVTEASDDASDEADADNAGDNAALAPVYQTEAARNTLTLHGLTPLSHSTEIPEAQDLPEEEEVGEASVDDVEVADEDNASEVVSPAEESTSDDPETVEATDVTDTDDTDQTRDGEEHEADTSDAVAHEEETTEAEPQVAARHAAPKQYEDVDPPETVPTDTGTIDLSSIRPGAVLPSRRALREARERGESFLMIDGQEFDTGLIPRVSRLDADDINKLNGAEEDTSAAHVEEYIVDMPEQSEPAQESQESPAGGWTSMMKSWALGRSNKGGKQ